MMELLTKGAIPLDLKFSFSDKNQTNIVTENIKEKIDVDIELISLTAHKYAKAIVEVDPLASKIIQSALHISGLKMNDEKSNFIKSLSTIIATLKNDNIDIYLKDHIHDVSNFLKIN